MLDVILQVDVDTCIDQIQKTSPAFNRGIAIEIVLVSAHIWFTDSIIRAFISMQHMNFSTILEAVSLCNKGQIGVWSEA